MVSSVLERLFAPNARRYLPKRFHSTFILITARPGLLFLNFKNISRFFPHLNEANTAQTRKLLSLPNPSRLR